MTTARTLDDRIVPAAGVSARKRAQGTGLALGALSAMCFGTSGTFGSALIGSGWSPAGAVLARVCVAGLALTVPALFALRRQWPALRRSGLRRSCWQVLCYGLIGVAACQICYFNAIARMDVGISILLEYMGIIWIVGWLWARHGQRPRLLTVLGGVAALGGLALMLNLSGHTAGGVNVTGVLWAVAAGAAMAVYFFQSSAPPAAEDTAEDTAAEDTAAAGAVEGAVEGAAAQPAVVLHPVVLTWGGMLTGAASIAVLGALGLTPLRLSGSPVTLLNDRVSWVVPLLGLGVIAAAVAYVTGIGAVRRLGAKLGSFVAMAEVLFAAGFAWVLLHQVPTGTQFLGGLLILGGVIAVRLDE